MFRECYCVIWVTLYSNKFHIQLTIEGLFGCADTEYVLIYNLIYFVISSLSYLIHIMCESMIL